MKNKLIGIVLLIHSAMTWFWMLGGYSGLVDFLGVRSTRVEGWITPGFLGVPLILSLLTLIIGLALLTGNINKKGEGESAEPKDAN